MEHQDWQNSGWAKKPAVAVPHIKRDPLDTDDPPPPVEISLALRTLIQKARLTKGLTQRQLAGKLNLLLTDVNGFESGKVIPDKRTLRRLSQVLGTKF